MARKPARRARKPKTPLLQRLRNDFLTGLVVVLPIFLTIYIVVWFVGFVDDKAMRERTRAILRELGTSIDPDREVSRLSIADRQLVQIARALLVPHKVVAFDEPTAVLTPIEAESLFEIIRKLRSQGVALLYISHRLNEVKAIADRVTVLRDGRHIATRDIEGLEPLEMARLMVGRDMSKLYPEKPATASDQPLLSVRDMAVPGYVENASFTLHRGEILGFGACLGDAERDRLADKPHLAGCERRVVGGLVAREL